MHEILAAGGVTDQPLESTAEWLSFLTNPQNLQPGLSDLTVYFGEARFSFVEVTFDSSQPSLRSFKLELNYVDDERIPIDWVPGLFRHPGLEELYVALPVSELPDHFHHIPKLKVAYLNESKLTRLPASFFQLPALERLSIHNVPLPEVPCEIGKMQSLRYLAFSQPCAPDVWRSFTELTELSCYASNVPPLDLPKLEKFSLRVGSNCNPIQARLPNLKELDTDHAEGFAGVLGSLKSLEKLSLSGKVREAMLPKLMDGLTQLYDLKYLSLDGVGISNINWCSAMTHLQYLSLAQNAIATIPSFLSNLQKLETIILRKNPITTIPDLAPMPTVTFIDIQETKIPIDPDRATDLHVIPEELVKLKRIFPGVEYLSSMI